MNKYYYTKSDKFNLRSMLRTTSILVSIGGLLIVSYIFLPIVFWQLYFAPRLAASLETPIPKTTVLNPSLIRFLTMGINQFSDIDYNNADNWFPTFKTSGNKKTIDIPTYSLTIPAIHLKRAVVSTVDNDLSSHLVQYYGTAIPSEKGNAVIFGHSTLPQLFDQNNYKTIFANAYLLRTGDSITARISNIEYNYKIYAVSVVEPTDTSVFSQNVNDSEITLVTCTPPGTTWKRLVVKARLAQI